jgi:hypothetical protein
MKPLIGIFGFFALAFLPLACGSQSDSAGTASVTGKVLWNNNPLPYGAVQFYDAEQFHTALIERDGNFKLDHLPEGQVTICIRTRGDLYADSRTAEEMNKFMKTEMKGKLPEGMTLEEMKEQMMAMAMKGKTPKGPGGAPGMFKKLPKGLPEAEAKMMEETPMVNGMPLLQAKGLPPEMFKMMSGIHDKYGEFHKSPLTYTVRPGEQSHDIFLKTTLGNGE